MCVCVCSEHCKSWPLWKLRLYLGSSWLFQSHPSWEKKGCTPLSNLSTTALY